MLATAPLFGDASAATSVDFTLALSAPSAAIPAGLAHQAWGGWATRWTADFCPCADSAGPSGAFDSTWWTRAQSFLQTLASAPEPQ